MAHWLNRPSSSVGVNDKCRVKFCLLSYRNKLLIQLNVAHFCSWLAESNVDIWADRNPELSYDAFILKEWSRNTSEVFDDVQRTSEAGLTFQRIRTHIGWNNWIPGMWQPYDTYHNIEEVCWAAASICGHKYFFLSQVAILVLHSILHVYPQKAAKDQKWISLNCIGFHFAGTSHSFSTSALHWITDGISFSFWAVPGNLVWNLPPLFLPQKEIRFYIS